MYFYHTQLCPLVADEVSSRSWPGQELLPNDSKSVSWAHFEKNIATLSKALFLNLVTNLTGPDINSTA